MPALDDYDPPAPMWLAVCCVLDKAEQPLIVSALRRELLRASRGRCGVSRGDLSRALQRMTDDGIVEVTPWQRKGRELRLYCLSDVGRELILEARGLAHEMLALSP